MLTNDVAYLIQMDDRIGIALKDPYTMKGYKLDSTEQLALLALFTSFIREKAEQAINSETSDKEVSDDKVPQH